MIRPNLASKVYVAFKGGMQIAKAKHWRGPYEVISPHGGVLPKPGPDFPIIEDAGTQAIYHCLW